MFVPFTHGSVVEMWMGSGSVELASFPRNADRAVR